MRNLLIALLLVASTAQAETWQQLTAFETKGSVLFLDTAGMTRSGQHRKARLKLAYDAEQPIPEGYLRKQPEVSTYRWDTNDYDFNCAKRTVALARSRLFSAGNEEVGRLDIPKRARTFRPATPGTSEGNILKAVCHWGEAREKSGSSAPSPDDFYPAGSKARNEQGAPIVKACVGPDGKLLRDPVVTGSSGFAELDAAAIKVARASRYTAATDNGVPQPESCIEFRVKFVVKE